MLSSGVGLLFALSLVALTLVPWIRTAVIQKTSVGLVALWFAAVMLNVASTGRPIVSSALIQLVILALLAFTWLPVRAASALVTSLYVLLLAAAAASRAPDVPGVLLTGFVLPLTWFLTLHGRAVNTERQRGEHLHQLAFTDHLTGVHNRRAGETQLAVLTEQWAGASDQLVAVLLDVDHFKALNDQNGHAQGDRTLQLVTRVLADHVRADDLVIRWGGEEFLLLLPGITARDARKLVEPAMHAVRRESEASGLPVTLSGGLSDLAESGSGRALIRLADERLYAAKAAGRNRLHAAT